MSLTPDGLRSHACFDLTRGFRGWKAPAYLSRRVGFDFVASVASEQILRVQPVQDGAWAGVNIATARARRGFLHVTLVASTRPSERKCNAHKAARYTERGRF